jgi:transcriptional regulator with XRE-family HTH domain
MFDPLVYATFRRSIRPNRKVYPVGAESQVQPFAPPTEAERKAFGKRLKEAREDRKWSQTELARRMGVERYATVSDWERGVNLPDNQQLFRLPVELGVSAAWLFHEVGAKHPAIFGEAEWRLQKVREALEARYPTASDGGVSGHEEVEKGPGSDLDEGIV